MTVSGNTLGQNGRHSFRGALSFAVIQAEVSRSSWSLEILLRGSLPTNPLHGWQARTAFGLKNCGNACAYIILCYLAGACWRKWGLPFYGLL